MRLEDYSIYCWNDREGEKGEFEQTPEMSQIKSENHFRIKYKNNKNYQTSENKSILE